MYLSRSVFVLFLFSYIVSCSPKKESFFMRYTSTDPAALKKEIVRKYAELANSKTEYDSFYVATELAESLTIAEREKEAIAILSPFITTQPPYLTSEDRAWLYLNFATANQYYRQATVAEDYFTKALTVADNYQLDSIKHYICHHYGRFLVEKKDYSLAKKYFTDALAIRSRLHDKHLVNTQKAIDTLGRIMNRSFD